MYNVPCTADMLKQGHVPFAVNISPFAELHPSEVSGIVAGENYNCCVLCRHRINIWSRVVWGSVGHLRNCIICQSVKGASFCLEK